MTNVTAGANAELPLFLLHLLAYDIGINEINERWADQENADVWSQAVIKQTEESIWADHRCTGYRNPAHRSAGQAPTHARRDRPTRSARRHRGVLPACRGRLGTTGTGVRTCHSDCPGRLQSNDAKTLTSPSKRWIRQHQNPVRFHATGHREPRAHPAFNAVRQELDGYIRPIQSASGAKIIQIKA